MRIRNTAFQHFNSEDTIENKTVPCHMCITQVRKKNIKCQNLLYFFYQENLFFLNPVLVSRHCTCAYTETVDPTRQPSIPQVRQGSVRFNLREEEPPPPLFPSCCAYSMGGWQHCSILFIFNPKTYRDASVCGQICAILGIAITANIRPTNTL